MTAEAKLNGGVSAETWRRFKEQEAKIRELTAESEHLRIALSSQRVLEQAKGAISARCDVTPDVAFEMMRGLARNQRREIHAYAAEVVANGGRLSPEE